MKAYEWIRQVDEDRSKRGFGDFAAKIREEFDKKHRFDSKKYPRLRLTDAHEMGQYANCSPEALIQAASTPLAKLAIAALWKNGDLDKLRHIARGVEDGKLLAHGDDRDAPVFRQFGAHLRFPSTQPIADQHTVRAWRYLKGRNLRDPAHTKDTIKVDEAVGYAEWVQSVMARQEIASANAIYEFDICLFEIGKATKYFIEKCAAHWRDA